MATFSKVNWNISIILFSQIFKVFKQLFAHFLKSIKLLKFAIFWPFVGVFKTPPNEIPDNNLPWLKIFYQIVGREC